MKNQFSSKKRVLVVGGGFAGLNLINRLAKSDHYEITLVDKNNYNYFTPLVYQVATGFLEASNISYPFRKLFRNKAVGFRMASVETVEPTANKVYLDDGGTLHYDILILAFGTKTNFFGNETIKSNSFSLKEIDDALFLRNQLVKTMEKAAIESDAAERKRLMTVVIAGGGPTGVEVAGMLAEMKRFILQKDYPNLNAGDADIYVVDGSPFLLSPMSEKSHQAAHKILDKQGVVIKLNTQVILYENGIVHLSDGSAIESCTLIWAAGVTGNSIAGLSKESTGRGGRLLTDGFNKLNGYDNIYAIGDISMLTTDPAYPNGHPQLAQPAIQQGSQLAKNLIREAKGAPQKPFNYFDRGDMAIIGRRAAVADLFKHRLHFSGLLGLLSWLFIHLISLVTYSNRLRTLYNWAVAYLTRDQALRMIFHSGDRKNR